RLWLRQLPEGATILVNLGEERPDLGIDPRVGRGVGASGDSCVCHDACSKRECGDALNEVHERVDPCLYYREWTPSAARDRISSFRRASYCRSYRSSIVCKSHDFAVALTSATWHRNRMSERSDGASAVWSKCEQTHLINELTR